MAKKNKQQFKQAPIRPDLKEKFKKLMAPIEKPAKRQTMFGFPVKNINQLWKWDTLEDVAV